MSVLKKLASETAIYGLSSIVGRLLNYILVPFYTRIFAPNEYGVVSDLYAWAGFLMVIYLYRMETAFFRYGTDEVERERAYSTTIYSIVGSTIFFCGAMIFFAPSIASWLQYADKSIYVVYFALILGLDVLSEIPFARLRLEKRPMRFASIKMTNILVNILANFFFLVVCPYILKHDSWANWQPLLQRFYTPSFGVGYVFLSNLIASGVTVLLLLPNLMQVKARFDFVLWKKMLGYSLPLVVVGFAGIINEVADRYLLKTQLPYTLQENLAQVGIYSGCYKLSILISLFTQAFRYAAEPFFFARAKDKNAPELYAKVSQYFTIISAFAFLLIMLYMDIFQTFIGKTYRVGLGIVPILLLANICLGLYYNFSVWYRLKDKTLLGAYIAIAGALVTILCNYWWIPSLGYMGSAWATLVCYVFMMLATYLLGQKYYPIPYPVTKMFAYLALSLGLYGLSMLFRPFLHENLCLILGINTLLLTLYAGVIYAIERKASRGIVGKNLD
jgi:O-antigen/teichoic acid export membrane protein